MTTTVPEPNKVDDGTVTITIDGVEIVAEKGELLISAAQRAGVFIPRFCYHDRLKPVGMCRMCLVEIEGVRGMPPACTTPVADGMVVNFKNESIEKVQDGVLEFLLINHPLDCPVCDRGGECPLQDQTLGFGPGESRFIEEKRHWEKPIEISDHVLLDRERCIQCSRCTRFADEVAGDPLITFVDRGEKTEVNTFPGDPFASYFSGNIVQICPVGALTAKPYRFTARPWDLESTETTCTGCSLGCKGTAQTSRNEMVRLLGVDSEPINQGWLCDKGRYGFDFAESENRIRSPYVMHDGKKEDVNLNAALDLASDAIAKAITQFGPDSVALLGGARGTNEDAYALSRLAKGVIGTSMVDSQLSNSLPADLVLSAKRARIADLDHACAIVVVGCDIKESHPIIFLRARKAVTENNVSLIDVNAAPTSTRSLGQHIDLIPGNEKQLTHDLIEVIDALRNAGQGNGKIVLIAGDHNPAQDAASFVELVESILGQENVVLLPSISPSNVMGAYEMGLAPGLLPGRVADTAQESYGDWRTLPSNKGAYTSTGVASIIEKAISGDIKVLILAGANPIAHYTDLTRATKALENVETIIALDCFENESTQHANIFLPVTVANEKEGTVTNVEGRVQRVVQVVAPQGNVFDDWKIATLLADRLGVESNIETAGDITNEIARTATSFAHLTTGILSRARDGAIVPVDDNKDVLVQSTKPAVDTPSWEPIASHAVADEDPRQELDREEHHPSANLYFAPMIGNTFVREPAHAQHLDQYSLRVIFVDSFYRESTMTENSGALNPVSQSHKSFAVRVHPKDVESVALRDDNMVSASNDQGSVNVRVIPDKFVTRGVMVATMSNDHPLRTLLNRDGSVTDVRIQGAE